MVLRPIQIPTPSRRSPHLDIRRVDDFNFATRDEVRASRAPGEKMRLLHMAREVAARLPALDHHDGVRIVRPLMEVVRNAALFLSGAFDVRLRDREQLLNGSGFGPDGGDDVDHWYFLLWLLLNLSNCQVLSSFGTL